MFVEGYLCEADWLGIRWKGPGLPAYILKTFLQQEALTGQRLYTPEPDSELLEIWVLLTQGQEP